MKAVSITALARRGSLKDEFEIRTLPRPEPASGQVRIRVSFAAVNIDDIRMAEGNFPVPGQSISPSAASPYVPGHDFAGVVDAVGSGVTRFAVGDRVYGQTDGSWAQYCLADAETVGTVPEAWTLQQAVSYVMGAAVARSAIDKLSDIRGKTGIIVGASGSIGNIALQYLVQRGANVWAVCSGRNEAAVTALGAARVLDYTKAPFDEQILSTRDKVSFVLDFVGGKETERSAYRVLEKGGLFVTAVGPMGFSHDADVTTWKMVQVGAYLAIRIITPSWVRPKFAFAVMPRRPSFATPPLGEDIKPMIDSEHPFDQRGVTSAIERVMSHRARGKVLIAFESTDIQKNAGTTTQPEDAK